jgi:hypothetical protein
MFGMKKSRGTKTKMSYRTNRRTKGTFRTSPTVDDSITVTHLGTRLHPWNIESRTADGRKFNLRVMALSQKEAIEQAHQKFPLIKIHKIHRAYDIRSKITREIRTATAELAKELGGPDEENGGESLL